MVIQLINHFKTHKLFYDGQYGFREGHSTEMACAELIDIITDDLDNNKISLNVYMDLSKAFDTLDHNIMLSKLKYYGLDNNAITLMESYLTNRIQFIGIDNIKSENKYIKTGSILGPLLLIIYINDLPLCSNIFKIIMYADDTTLTTTLDKFKIRENETINMAINSEITKISDWLKLNKLSLNIKKTKCMILHMPNRHVCDIHLHIDNIKIEVVDNFDFLGMRINKHLKWKPHIDTICDKISEQLE